MEHRTIQGIGGEVHYWISRPGGGTGEAIVFTHGLTADHTMYEKQVDYFRNGYTVIVWDVPMHGLSAPYRDFSYENTAKDLNAILLQEGIERVSLVGMSMGGYPSQMFAHLYPEKTKCFVALDTTPFGSAYYSKSDLWWLARVKPMLRLFPAGVLRWSMARAISLTDYSYNKMMEILSPVSKERIAEQMDIGYGVFARENRDLRLTCPVLILLGDRDRTGKIRQYCFAWSEATGYPLHIIRRASHFANGDNPEQVNAEIEQFIRQAEAAV